jgi:hypothetical protein
MARDPSAYLQDILEACTANEEVMSGVSLKTYLVFFVLAWGWIFWRIDWVGQSKPGGVIEVADAGDHLSMFDYYHASLMSIVRRSHSEVIGKTRNGRMLVAIHTFMVLDLIAVALGRFYQLIIKMI